MTELILSEQPNDSFDAQKSTDSTQAFNIPLMDSANEYAENPDSRWIAPGGVYVTERIMSDMVYQDHGATSAPEPDTGSFWLKLNERTHGQVPKVRIEYWPTLCNQCSTASYMTAAPDEVYRREEGLIIIDPEKSKGMKTLVGSCLYGQSITTRNWACPRNAQAARTYSTRYDPALRRYIGDFPLSKC